LRLTIARLFDSNQALSTIILISKRSSSSQ
jgi:hypothetical protein